MKLKPIPNQQLSKKLEPRAKRQAISLYGSPSCRREATGKETQRANMCAKSKGSTSTP
jgi:hypothetical protein